MQIWNVFNRKIKATFCGREPIKSKIEKNIKIVQVNTFSYLG
jgi:hypothetical protein